MLTCCECDPTCNNKGHQEAACGRPCGQVQGLAFKQMHASTGNALLTTEASKRFAAWKMASSIFVSFALKVLYVLHCEQVQLNENAHTPAHKYPPSNCCTIQETGAPCFPVSGCNRRAQLVILLAIKSWTSSKETWLLNDLYSIKSPVNETRSSHVIFCVAWMEIAIDPQAVVECSLVTNGADKGNALEGKKEECTSAAGNTFFCCPASVVLCEKGLASYDFAHQLLLTRSASSWRRGPMLR